MKANSGDRPRRGRPPAREVRGHDLRVPVTPVEREAIERLAGRLELSVAETVRRVVLPVAHQLESGVEIDAAAWIRERMGR